MGWGDGGERERARTLLSPSSVCDCSRSCSSACTYMATYLSFFLAVGGFGPGYNVMGGLTTAKDKSVLLLSKPTANLHGDSSGKRPNCAAHTQGSCAYRRNLTLAQSLDGGASWSVQPWGLIYPGRIVSAPPRSIHSFITESVLHV